MEVWGGGEPVYQDDEERVKGEIQKKLKQRGGSLEKDAGPCNGGVLWGQGKPFT